MEILCTSNWIPLQRRNHISPTQEESMKRMYFFAWRPLAAALVIGLIGLSSQISAQTTTASISGIVTDERQAVVANATVNVRSVETNLTRSTTTDSGGRYRVGNL